MKVPLAWLNLTHDKRRFLVAVAGITFAVLLMFMELGFWNGMLDSVVGLINRFNADLVIVNKLKYALYVNETFTRHRLEQAGAVEGVAHTYPLYMEFARSLWRSTRHRGRGEPINNPIRVIGYDPLTPVLDIPAVQEHASELLLPDTALIDVRSKAQYGSPEPGTTTELSQRTVRVVGNFTLGTDFTADGNLIMSDGNFAHFFPAASPRTNPLDQVQVGLVRLRGGADPVRVQQQLRDALPDDVEVFTKQEFADQEMHFWQTSSPIGFIFGLGLAMGFVVGVVICYQILSADIGDHLSEYATLKAIGYGNRFLTRVVMGEALWLALLGFLPGYILGRVLYDLVENGTGMPMRLTWNRAALVLGLTVAMCLTSGVIAIRKVQAADPAEVF